MKKSYAYVKIFLLIGLLFVLSVPAQAASWDAATSEGITSVDVILNTNTYTWTLNNLSGTDLCPLEYDDLTVLVWSLQPFNVYEPVSTTPPPGWIWDGSSGKWQCYEIEDSGEKYYTPPAIAPGGSLVFTYTYNPSGSKINPFPADYEGDPINDIGFISHVAAVTEPTGEGLPWVPDQNGGTWYDRSDWSGTIVPEPASAMVLVTLGIPLAASFFRRRRTS